LLNGAVINRVTGEDIPLANMKFDGTNKDLIPGAFKSDWTYTGK